MSPTRPEKGSRDEKAPSLAGAGGSLLTTTSEWFYGAVTMEDL